MSNTVRGSRPWLCEYLAQCLERDSQPPVLNGKYAQVLTVNAASREMLVFDGEYSAQALLTQEAANELTNDGSGISVQGLLGRTLAPVDIILVQELNLVPPSVTLIIKKMKVFPDSMSHRPVRDPPFAAAAPAVRQKLRALHLKQITMPVPEMPAPGSELVEQLVSEMELSDSPPRSVRLEPCPIPEKPPASSEANAPCLRFADASNDSSKKRGDANGIIPNEDEDTSTIEVDEEEHSHALPELTSSLRVHSPPPLEKGANGDIDSDTNGISVDTQLDDANSLPNTQRLPMTQFDQTEDMDDDQSDIAETEIEKETSTCAAAKSVANEAQNNNVVESNADLDAVTEEKPNIVVNKTEIGVKEKLDSTADDSVLIPEHNLNHLMDTADVNMAAASTPAEDTIMTESKNSGLRVEELKSSVCAAAEPNFSRKREQNEGLLFNRERDYKKPEETSKDELPGLLIEDETIIAKVSGIVDDALRLLDGMTQVDGPWELVV